jgi:hypothetical protein
VTRHPEHSEDCPQGDFGHCDHWYDGGLCCHCQNPKTNMDIRETPAKLSLVGKTVRLVADPNEGWPEEDIHVEADYEARKPDGFQRFLQGVMADGQYTEVPYDQLKEVL